MAISLEPQRGEIVPLGPNPAPLGLGIFGVLSLAFGQGYRITARWALSRQDCKPCPVSNCKPFSPSSSLRNERRGVMRSDEDFALPLGDAALAVVQDLLAEAQLLRRDLEQFVVSQP